MNDLVLVVNEGCLAAVASVAHRKRASLFLKTIFLCSKSQDLKVKALRALGKSMVGPEITELALRVRQTMKIVTTSQIQCWIYLGEVSE